MSRYTKAYLAGWDSALVRPCGPVNAPYQRADFAGRFNRGRRACLAGEPMPPRIFADAYPNTVTAALYWRRAELSQMRTAS